MNESHYQNLLVDKIKRLIPGSHVLKTDPRDIQGVPDLLVLYQDRWAMLEVKISKKAKHQPNQLYYVELFGEMSYASFVNPENEEEVLYELQQALGVEGSPRIS